MLRVGDDLPMTKTANFNAHVGAIAPPPIPTVLAWADAYDGGRGPLLDFSQAVPGYPPHGDLLAWLSTAAGDAGLCGYGPIEGEDVFRSAYGAHMSALYGAALTAENVQATAGCNQAFFTALMAIAGAGDAVLMVSPYYFNHESTLAMLGVAPTFAKADAENGFLPTANAIRLAITPNTRAVALVTPNNPTGAVYPRDLLSDIYDVCRDAGVWLIVDETYRDFLDDADRAPHDLFQKPDWQQHLISLSSFSKSFCIPGHRLGAVTASATVVSQIAKVMDNLQICAPRPPQVAVAKGLTALTQWQQDNRIEIQRRADELRRTFTQLPDWRIASVGAYFAFVRHPYAGQSSVDVCRRLAETAGVTMLPGKFFGDAYDGYLRLAFANADCARIALLKDRLAV